MEMKPLLLLLALCFYASSCAAQEFLRASDATHEDDPTIVKGGKLVGELGVDVGDGIRSTSMNIYENKLPTIKKIIIDESFFEARADCIKGHPTIREVKEYFELAYEISRYAYMQTLITDPCTSSGRIEFADGTNGRWFFSITSRGSLYIDGKEDKYFYCPKCSDLFTLDDLDEETLKKYGRDPETGEMSKK